MPPAPAAAPLVEPAGIPLEPAGVPTPAQTVAGVPRAATSGQEESSLAELRDRTAPPATTGPELASAGGIGGGGSGGEGGERAEEGADSHAAVFKRSRPLPASTPVIRGYDFNDGVEYDALLASLATTGFQAQHFGQAVEEIRRMLRWRLSDEPLLPDCRPDHCDPHFRRSTGTKIFLGCTSNLISSGVRETIRYLVEHRLVDVLVTTAGGVEEDLIKCLAPTFAGEFELDGAALRARGLNRIGNLLVPNDNYCKFEDWVNPILDAMLKEQKDEGTLWTPSRVVARLGREIAHQDSIAYWAQRNNIPIYCPALTDGSLGDMIYFHSYRHPGLVIDIVEDIRLMNGEAVYATPRKTGVIILGGGVPKHHISNANLMRNGSDFAVYVNTAQEFDGSDSGARPDEAVSWGKIKGTTKAVKVTADATIVFPLLVAETFAKEMQARKQDADTALPG